MAAPVPACWWDDVGDKHGSESVNDKSMNVAPLSAGECACGGVVDDVCGGCGIASIEYFGATPTLPLLRLGNGDKFVNVLERAPGSLSGGTLNSARRAWLASI